MRIRKSAGIFGAYAKGGSLSIKRADNGTGTRRFPPSAHRGSISAQDCPVPLSIKQNEGMSGHGPSENW